MIMLLDEKHEREEELMTLRSMAMVNATQTTEVWRTATEAWATQKSKLEQRSQSELEAMKIQYEEKFTNDSYRKQLELQHHLHEFEKESSHQKDLIKGLLEEQADTLLREQQMKERLTMKAEDYLSKAYEYKDFWLERQRPTDQVVSRAVLDDNYSNLARKEELAKWDAIEADRDQAWAAILTLQATVDENNWKQSVMTKEMQEKNAVLDKTQDELKKLKVFSLQPQTAAGKMIPVQSNSGGNTSSAPRGKDKDLKGLMRDFLQELLKGKEMRLVTEGGGSMPARLTIKKDLKTLLLQAVDKMFSIPVSEIQQVISGKELPPTVWTSTPVDEHSITILFGPSVDEQHTCCFRELEAEKREKFVNSMKVLLLSTVTGETPL
jgi:hypothetical protein